jgi:predicted dehydrogenase
MVKIGIIGCGKIAQVRHLPEYAANPCAQLIGYYDINAERAKMVAGQYGGKVYESYQSLLADPRIDAVSVMTSNATHSEITVAALDAGKHVLCEKPMAMNLEECEAMVEAARRTSKKLMLGHNQRLTKTHRKAKALIAAGDIGNIITFRTQFGHAGPDTWSVDGKNSWFFDKNQAVLGAMADLGIHKTDLIQYLTGQRIVEVSAMIKTLDKRDESGALIPVDDNSICIYKLNGGAIGTMTASWTTYGCEDNSTVLYGTKGIMSIYKDPAYSIIIDLREGGRICYALDAIQTITIQTASGVIDLFIKCIMEDIEPEISGEEALSAMKAIFAAVESSRTGQTVKVDNTLK